MNFVTSYNILISYSLQMSYLFYILECFKIFCTFVLFEVTDARQLQIIVSEALKMHFEHALNIQLIKYTDFNMDTYISKSKFSF